MEKELSVGDLVVRRLDEFKDNPDLFLINEIEKIAGYEFAYLMDFTNRRIIKKLKSDYISFEAWKDRAEKIKIAALLYKDK